MKQQRNKIYDKIVCILKNKRLSKTLYLFSVLIIISLFSISNQTSVTQRITHFGYFPSNGLDSDYHSYEIQWETGTSNIVDRVVESGTKTYKYSTRRDTIGTTYTAVNNGNSLNDRYAEYLMEINGIHYTKNYVAWDITPTDCNSTYDITTVTFKAKFFPNEYEALVYYDSLSDTANKARFTYTAAADTTTQEFLSTEVKNSNIIGMNQDFILLCASQ